MEIYSDDYFMKEALKEAQKAFDADEVPVGAVVVSQNKIIARAHNLTERLNDVTAHAEMQAITAVANAIGAKYLLDCTMYVTLEPCPMCAGALNWSQITRVVYGASDEKRGFAKISPSLLHTKTLVSVGVQEKACSEIIKKFFNSKRI